MICLLIHNPFQKIICYSILTALISIDSHSTAQTTFNKHYHFGQAYIQTGGILPVDDGYLYVGQSIDTTDFLFHWIIGKVDLNGDPVCHQTFREPYHAQKFTFSDIISYDEKTFLTVGSDSLFKIYAAVFDENCDTVFTRIHTPVYQGPDTVKAINVTKVRRAPNGNLVVIGNVAMRHTAPKGGLFVFDENLEMIGYDYYGPNGTGLRYNFDQIFFDADDNILVFGTADRLGFREDTNFVLRIGVWTYSASGTRIDVKWTPPDLMRGSYLGATILADSSGYITSAARGRPYLFQQIGSYRLYGVEFSQALQKLDKNLNIIWETPIGDEWQRVYGSFLNQVLSLDSIGIVASGDYVPLNDTSGHSIGFMVKVGWEGNIIWTRSFVADSVLSSDCRFFDIEATPDGGYAMNGLASFFEGWPSNLDQHLWLVKTDPNGCIVPGCEVVSTIDPEQREPHEFLLYPNPARETINIYVNSLGIRDSAQFRIVNTEGRLMYTHLHLINDVTYSINTSQWPSGIYYCQILSDGAIEASKVFFVQH